MNIKKALIVFMLWLPVYIWTVGALNADIRHCCDGILSSPQKTLEFKRQSNRRDLAFSLGLSLMPLTIVIAPFMTGFYEHGWVIAPPTIEEFQK